MLTLLVHAYTSGPRLRFRSTLTLQVYAYPEKKQFGQPKRRERQTLTFVADRFVFFDLNLETANRWKAAILRLKSANRPITDRDLSTVSV